MPRKVQDTTPRSAEDASERLKRAVVAELDLLCARRLEPGLYLVATPIGHLGDATLRALSTLLLADAVYCEDTRVSQTLTSRFGITRRLSTYHEHSATALRSEIVDQIAAGRSVALISDAGTPAISDPGFKLVREVVGAGHRVVPVPGPAAFVAALTSSGLPTDQFHFAGFVPAKQSQRLKFFEALAGLTCSICFYESPHRVAASLHDMASALGGNRPGCVARELTKKYEELVRGPLAELADWAQTATVRGEIAIVVGPPPAEMTEVSDEAIAERLRALGDGISPSRAAKQVADALGVPKARVYAIGLQSKRGGTCKS